MVSAKGNIAAWSKRQALDQDGEIKAPPSAGRMWLGRFEFLSLRRNALAIRFVQDLKHFNDPSAIRPISC